MADFDLDEHEIALLRQACATADLCEQLQAVIDAEGPLISTRQGDTRTHPAVVELRNQRILLARLIVALRVPLGEDKDNTQRGQRRGTRGVYGIRGAV